MGIQKDIAAEALGEVFGELDERALIDAAIRKKLRGRPAPGGPGRTGPALSISHAAGLLARRRLLGAAEIPHRAARRSGLSIIMRSRDIRRGFLEYFQKNGHTIAPSSSLVPGDDPTLLFTNAGMNQFKDLFLGREKRAYTRATTSQKCMRVSGKHNDLDNVGPSLRHHTFFEMLGNFSFGDYFKREAIQFAWELLTTVWNLPADRLFPTIFNGDAGIPRDEEAHAIWTQFVPAARITELGLAENFWQMGETGPCGRCSEIHYYRGSHIPCEEEQGGGTCRDLDCSCDRYVEVWNNVFMEFDRQADGTLNPLPAPSIDTGMGLERITAVIQGKLSNYDTDLFMPLLDAIGEKVGRRYGASIGDPADISMRVIADHLRAMTFLISDGVVPSNEWRGYVLRKIMRRAMRHGKKLGFTEPMLHTLVPVIVREMGDAYPQLLSDQDNIVRTVRSEEERFDAVLTAGLPRLEDAIDRAAAGARAIPGEEAFRLYDSLGMPLDFMEDVAGQRNVAHRPRGVRSRDAGAEGPCPRGELVQDRRKRPDDQRAAGVRARVHERRGRVHRLRLDAVDGCAGDWRLRRQGRMDQRARRGPGGLHRAAAHAVLPRVRRPGLRPGAAVRRRRLGSGRAADGALRAGTAAAAPRACDERGLPARTDRVGGGAGRAARRDSPQPHRHSPAARGAAAGARFTRQAGRIARRTRSAALRLRPLRGHSARRPARDRTDRQRADSPQHRGADGGPLDGGSDRGGGDGPVRREIRGSCPRRLRAGLQPRAVRRHARQGDRRHRLLRDHRGERRRGRRAPHRGAGPGRKPSSARSSSARPSSRCRRC